MEGPGIRTMNLSIRSFTCLVILTMTSLASLPGQTGVPQPQASQGFWLEAGMDVSASFQDYGGYTWPQAGGTIRLGLGLALADGLSLAAGWVFGGLSDSPASGLEYRPGHSWHAPALGLVWIPLRSFTPQPDSTREVVLFYTGLGIEACFARSARTYLDFFYPGLGLEAGLVLPGGQRCSIKGRLDFRQDPQMAWEVGLSASFPLWKAKR